MSNANWSIARWLAVTGLTLAVVCVLAAMASGLGYRLGLWHFRMGFQVLRVAAFASLAAAAISLLGVALGKGARNAWLPGAAGLVLALGLAYVQIGRAHV